MLVLKTDVNRAIKRIKSIGKDNIKIDLT